MLLERFEEQLNLPASHVNGGDGAATQTVVVGQEHQDFAGIRVERCDTAQQM